MSKKEDYVDKHDVIHSPCKECDEYTMNTCPQCGLCDYCCDHQPNRWRGSHLGHPKPRKDSPIRNRIADLYFKYPCYGENNELYYGYMMEGEGLTEYQCIQIRRIGKKIYLLNGCKPHGREQSDILENIDFV